MGRAVIAPSPGGPDRPARPAARGLALSHSPSTRTRRPWRRGLFFSDFPFCTRHSGVKDCAVPPCVDGPWNARLLYRWDRSGSVMCPAFYRGIVATGPDEVRGWRANQFVELKALGEPRLCSIPGPTGSPSLLSPSFLRSTIAEPDSSNGCVPVSLLSSQKSPRDAGGLVCDRYRHHACRFALQELRDPWE